MGTERRYKPGSFYRIDDRTGFAVRAEHTRKQWNNIIVRTRSFEARQPQDFVRGRRDDQTVPEPRPRQINAFLGVQTTVLDSIIISLAPNWTLVESPGLPVTSAAGFNVGDQISIQLDNGSTFFTTASAIDYSANTITPSSPLPYPATGGNIVTDMTSFANV